MKSSILKSLLLFLVLSLVSFKALGVEKADPLLTWLNSFFNNKLLFTDQNLDKRQLPKPFNYLLTQPIMTLALEKYYSAKMKIEKISSESDDDIYKRAIIMHLDSPDKTIVEFALIKINLFAFPKKVIHQIIHSTTPFGKILIKNHIKSSSKIQKYFSIKCNSAIEKYIHCTLNQTIYCRVNFITDNNGRLLAQVIEVLPDTSVRHIMHHK